MGILMSLVQTCRVMNINVLEYLEDVLRRINGHPASKLHELLPGNWKKVGFILQLSPRRTFQPACTSNDAYVRLYFFMDHKVKNAVPASSTFSRINYPLLFTQKNHQKIAFFLRLHLAFIMAMHYSVFSVA